MGVRADSNRRCLAPQASGLDQLSYASHMLSRWWDSNPRNNSLQNYLCSHWDTSANQSGRHDSNVHILSDPVPRTGRKPITGYTPWCIRSFAFSWSSGSRSHDLMLNGHLLFQLSYTPISKIPELVVRIPGLLCCYIVLSFYGLRCISTECTHTNHAGGLLCLLAHWLLICMIIIQSHVFIYSVSKSIYSSLLILFIWIR